MRLKGKFFIVFAFALCFIKVSGQVVAIPDPQFRACAKDINPRLIDANGNLVVSEAAKITGVSCTNRNISNVEGLQYFTSATSINLSENKLSFIPQISSLGNLRNINVTGNLLQELPPLEKLVRLTHLNVRRNQLTKFPDLSSNSALLSLIAHNNLMDTFPSVDALVNLQELQLSHNRMRYFPSVDKLTALKDFRIWSNRLVELPSFKNLPNLRYLNASYNQLKNFPEFDVVNVMDSIFLETNLIDTLPDLSHLKNIDKIRLYDNRLTFKDLVALQVLPGYKDIFKADEQAIIKIARLVKAREKQLLILNSGIDKGVEGVVYEWFFNGQLIQKSTSDEVKAITADNGSSGFYNVIVTHPSFPGLRLTSDSIQVVIDNCINVNSISLIITGIGCTSQGTLEVKPFDQPTNGFQYELKSTITGKVLQSKSGLFINLQETSYTLTIKNEDQCIKQLPYQVIIPKEECREAFITPNGDGVDDTYFIPYSGTAKISDKWGNVIKQLKVPAEWNGAGLQGHVNPGLYLISVNDGQEVIKISVVY